MDTYWESSRRSSECSLSFWTSILKSLFLEGCWTCARVSKISTARWRIGGRGDVREIKRAGMKIESLEQIHPISFLKKINIILEKYTFNENYIKKVCDGKVVWII